MLRVPAMLWPVLRLSELAIHLVVVLPTMAMPTKLCSARVLQAVVVTRVLPMLRVLR
jgi:hypothetical protein